MAKSARARAFEAEHGVPDSQPSRNLVIVEPSDESDGLFDVIDADTSHSAQPQQRDTEPHIAEPEIIIEGTKLGTRGSNLASTALKNIMDTFNAANQKSGLNKSTKGEPKHRFYTHFGGVQASLPHKVVGFMEGNTLSATLDEKGVVKTSDSKFQKPPKHLKDLEVLNNTNFKRTMGWPEELIIEDRERLKTWLIDNYGSGAVQEIAYEYGDPVKHKVDKSDRAKLVAQLRRLEKDAKKIASGEMLPYGSRPFDDTEEAPDPLDYEEES